MKTLKFKEYTFRIGNSITTIYVTKTGKDRYLTKFTQQPKDYINAVGADGLTTTITRLGDRLPIHTPRKVRSECSLTEEQMKEIWDQIEKIGLPD